MLVLFFSPQGKRYHNQSGKNTKTLLETSESFNFILWRGPIPKLPLAKQETIVFFPTPQRLHDVFLWASPR